MLKTPNGTSPKIKKYFNEEELFLKIGGITLTGKDSFIYKIYSVFVVYGISVSYTVIQASKMFKNEFSVAAEAGIYFASVLMGTVMIIVAHWNRVRVGKLFDKLEQKPFLANRERGGDVEENLIRGWFSFKQKQSLALFIGASGTISLSSLYSLIIRIRNNDYHDWRLPFGPITILNVTYSPNYEISWLYQNISLFYLCVNACAVTLIIASTLAFIGVQFKLLQNVYRRLGTNSYEKMLRANGASSSLSPKIDYSNIPWKYLKESIKEAVDYHVSIIELAKDFEEVFSIVMFTVYFCTLGILCFEVYRASVLSAERAHIIVAIIEALVVPFHSFVMCYNGQQMTNEGLNAVQCAYECDFIGSDVRFQKVLTIIIMRNQKPVMIKAGKFIETSMLTFLWIIRSGYSTFMVLRNLQNK